MSDRGLDDPEYLQREIERLTAERDDARSTLGAWFEIKSLAEAQMIPEFIGCVQGYLRTSRNGGMPQEQSDLVDAVLEDFASKYLIQTIWPMMLRIAEEKRGELKVPAGMEPRNGMTDQKIFESIERHLKDMPKMPTDVCDMNDHEQKFFDVISYQSGMMLFLQHVFIDRLRHA